MKKNNDGRYKYSVMALHRGAVLSLIVVALIFIAFITGFGFKQGFFAEPTVLILTAIFICFHIIWDEKIRANHISFDLLERAIVFHCGDDRVVLNECDIKEVEYFPDRNNIYDDDYIVNMMSSGVRILNRDNKKFLIFSKVGGFKDVQLFLDQWHKKKP